MRIIVIFILLATFFNANEACSIIEKDGPKKALTAFVLAEIAFIAIAILSYLWVY